MADAALLAGIAPRPAEALIEQLERIAVAQFADDFGIFVRSGAKLRTADNRSPDRLGIMRGDHAADERHVGEILAIGIEPRVRPLGRAG
jgi:hypothetical protein